jgi:hypothetical protein
MRRAFVVATIWMAAGCGAPDGVPGAPGGSEPSVAAREAVEAGSRLGDAGADVDGGADSVASPPDDADAGAGADADADADADVATAPPGAAWNGAGAVLPVSTAVSTLPGTARYVAPNGSDATGDGSLGRPFATLARAHAASAAGDSIVVRGGTYREGGVAVTKSVTISAYPGEIPVFDGAQAVASGWTADGGARYIAYAPRPATDGSGISFTQNQNLSASTSYVGKYPDQVWMGGVGQQKELAQIDSIGLLADGKFFVDRAAGRLYLTAADAARSDIEVSNEPVFMTIRAPNVTVRGLRVTRFSNTASDGGVINVSSGGDHVLIEHIEVVDASFMSISMQGNSDLNQGGVLRHVTVTGANWMGINATYTDDLTLDAVKVTNLNRFGEFTFSPQSGALKTSRTRRTKVLHSVITGNNSHGLWFDQSNVDVDVAGSLLTDNAGTALFFEISDDLTLINCEIRASGGARAVKLAGSSGLKLVNNTIVGGADPIGIYVDSRSLPGCADPAHALCSGSYSSDRDTVRSHPATLDWMPRLDLMLNNVVVSPTAVGYCASITALCITDHNGSASKPVETVLHQADSARALPASRLDGNVYLNGTQDIIDTVIGRYRSTDAFSTAMAGKPVDLAGLESSGHSGASWVQANGTPTAALTAAQAPPIPVDANLNQYLPAGLRHFGTTWR